MAAIKNYHGEPWHTLEGRIIREIVFGINDGLITAFGFVSGVSSAHIQPILIFATGLAQAAAGAISMCFGSYLSTKAQRDFFQKEIAREKLEIETEPAREADEIREVYQERGFTPDEVEMIVKRITSDKNRFLSFMIHEELGLSPEHFDNPLKAGAVIGASFLVGAIVPVFPYILGLKALNAVFLSTILTLIALFAVGIGKGKFTKTSWLTSGLEMLIVGVIAGGVGIAVGKLLNFTGLSGY